MAGEEAAEERGAGAWVEAVELDALPTDGGGLTLELSGARLALFREGERVLAIADACPHMGASLGLGVSLAGEVSCPWHGWHFRLEDGRNTDGLEACVTTYRTRIEPDGRVLVHLP
jgi:nitrite reductase/ring-hydroxylating ferredoxin subunit